MLLLDAGSGLLVTGSMIYDDHFTRTLNFSITITHGCKCGTIFCYSGICKRFCCENKTCCNQQNKNCAEKTFYHNFFLLSLSENNYALFFFIQQEILAQEMENKKGIPHFCCSEALGSQQQYRSKDMPRCVYAQ